MPFVEGQEDESVNVTSGIVLPNCSPKLFSITTKPWGSTLAAQAITTRLHGTLSHCRNQREWSQQPASHCSRSRRNSIAKRMNDLDTLPNPALRNGVAEPLRTGDSKNS